MSRTIASFYRCAVAVTINEHQWEVIICCGRPLVVSCFIGHTQLPCVLSTTLAALKSVSSVAYWCSDQLSPYHPSDPDKRLLSSVCLAVDSPCPYSLYWHQRTSWWVCPITHETTTSHWCSLIVTATHTPVKGDNSTRHCNTQCMMYYDVMSHLVLHVLEWIVHHCQLSWCLKQSTLLMNCFLGLRENSTFIYICIDCGCLLIVYSVSSSWDYILKQILYGSQFRDQGKSFCKNFFSSRDVSVKVQKQARDENMQEDYPTM